MVTVSHGADAERLRGVGRELTSSAEQLADVATAGRSMARVLAEHWSGADLEHFVGQGWPGAETVLHSASELVRGLGEGATRNADEQEGASEGAGSDGETLTIDPAAIGTNPRWAISAAAHEARHVVQREAMDMANPKWWQFWKQSEDMEGVAPGLVDDWKENEDTGYHGLPDPALEQTDPQAYEEQLQAYYDQPIEADAYRVGTEYVSNMTVEEMERLLEEAGG